MGWDGREGCPVRGRVPALPARPAQGAVRLREGPRRAAAGWVPDAPLSVGPRLSAMAVYLSVFQHVPVERAQFLIADLTGGVLSAGFAIPAWGGPPGW